MTIRDIPKIRIVTNFRNIFIGGIVMKNNLFKKMLAGVMAGTLSIATFTVAAPITSFAEESEAVVTKSFTLNEIVCNTSVTSQKATLGSQSEVTFELSTDSVVNVSDLAPEYEGYHIQRADYKKGYSNYVGIDYFYLSPYTVSSTGETAYSVYFHYTGANGTLDLKQAAAHSKGTHLFVHYALNEYKVAYSADEDVTNVPVDENIYTIENADEIVISPEVPVKDGYIFDGWVLEETGAIYQPGDVIALTDLTNEAVNFTASFTELPKASVDVNTEVVTSWEDKVQLNITVTNASDSAMNNWKVAFDFDGIIDQIWNAEILSAEDGEYIIGHPSWKTDLAAGESYTFGIIATKNSEETPSVVDSTLVSQEVTADTSSYEVVINKSEWSYGYNGEIVITNKSENSLEGWRIEFDFQDDITNIWNATIVSHEGTHYVIENAGYNDTIAALSSVSFGFSASPADSAEYSSANIENVVLTVVK